MATIENLSNEIFYEIFDYLHGFEIFHAFTNLNERFNGLIYHSAQLIKFSQSSLFDSIPRQNHAQFIIDNNHRTISLSIPNEFYLLTIYDRSRTKSSNHHLESISISNISYPHLLQLLSYFKTLPRLSSLTILLHQQINNLTEIYRSVFALPLLKYAKLSSQNQLPALSLPLKIKQSSGIERLVLDHTFQNLDDLLRILFCTPQVTHLTCKNILSDKSQTKSLLATACHLRYLSVRSCDWNTAQLDILIRKLCSQCQVLRLDTLYYVDHLVIQHWEQLILQNMPHLTRLELRLQLSSDDPDHFLSSISKISHFLSSFWIQRKLTLKLQIYRKESLNAMFYHSFEPPVQQWYQLEENLNDNQQKLSEARFSQFYADLTAIKDTQELPIYDTYLDALVGFFQCNSLHVNLDEFEISTVLHCLNRWVEVDSLIITFKESNQSEILHELDDSSRYKITKLSIEHFVTVYQLISLINVCLDLSHLQLKCRNINDAQGLIRYISTEQSSHRFRQLHFICLWFPLADENTMEILQEFMHTERLLDNHTIKRIDERVCIKWKKTFVNEAN